MGRAIAYYIDKKMWEEKNKNNENYFDIYIEEMLDKLD